MKSFEFQNYRDGLARDLAETRDKEGREIAKIKIDAEKNTEDYKNSEMLHRASNELPKDAVLEAAQHTEVIVDPSQWDVTDISDLIPRDYKYLVDRQILGEIERRLNNDNDVEWDKRQWPVRDRLDTIRNPYQLKNVEPYYEHERGVKLLDRERRDFLDEISGHRYSDNHTLTHSVTALASSGTQKYFGKTFDPHSIIEPSQAEIEYSKFWMYPAGLSTNVEKPMVIFSADNPGARSFFEREFHPGIEEVMGHLIREEQKDPGKFLKDLKARAMYDNEDFVGFNVMSYFGDPDLARIFFLAGIPMSGREKYCDQVSGQIQFPFETREQALARRKEGQDGPDNLTLKTSWMDIADCIIDLRQRKVWTRKYSDDEVELVEAAKRRYKEWLEQNLFHCTTEEFVEKARKK